MSEPLPAGPWRSRREVEAIIGPVRRVLGPRWGHRFPVYAAVVPLFVMTGLVAFMVLFCAAHVAGFIHMPTLAQGFIVPLVGMAGLTVAGFYTMWHRLGQLGNRLLVGEGGLVEWTLAGGTLVAAEDLGVHWVAHLPDSANDGDSHLILFALQHVPSGKKLYVTDFYADAPFLVQLLREKLAERAPGRWADLSHWKPRPASTSSRIEVTVEPDDIRTLPAEDPSS
jgi:hypothetical protein